MVARPRSLWTPRWWTITGILVWLAIGALGFAELMSWPLAAFLSTTWWLFWMAVLARVRKAT